MSTFLRSPSKQHHAKVIDAENPHRRVILLLDMDCFYAQCEVVRLGVDRSIPLALVQWRSALAVNYPAREFGIKRGDSFEAIQEKSNGQCVAIHLPVTPVDEILPMTKSSPEEYSISPCKGNTNVGDGGNEHKLLSPQKDEQSASINDDGEEAYDEEFNQPEEVREEMYRMEKNRMRSPSEGKACLDRYRLASSRIFSLIDETLAKNLGRKNFILERASIDELFIDVTASCYQSAMTDNDKESNDNEPDTATQFRSECETNAIQSLEKTVICHEASLDSGEKTDEIGKALRLGCHIASTVRHAVFEELGFTLSAGISTSKLVSKLAATYGKPNGQAVVFPGTIASFMEETQIRKARMLGGKLGKRVSALLPDTETTMGSISRLLPLDQLEKAIGEDSGRWVFDACRGIDFEEVKPTLKVLLKSITAFKSFPKVSYPELEKWTALLARDIMKRVETDSARNHRFPKSCTIGYTMVPGGAWIGRTFRLTFPTDKDFNVRVQKLVDNTRKALTERGHSSFIRIGFSAIDFVVRPKVGIDSFFKKGKTQSSTTKRLGNESSDGKKEALAKPGGIDCFFSNRNAQPATSKSTSTTSPQPKVHRTDVKAPYPTSIQKESRSAIVLQEAAKGTCSDEKVSEEMSSDAPEPVTNITDEDIARQLQDSYDNDVGERDETKKACSSDSAIDKDKAFALHLQSTFDRENSVLSHVERFSAKRKGKPNTKSQKKGDNSKRSKIDFFLKK